MKEKIIEENNIKMNKKYQKNYEKIKKKNNLLNKKKIINSIDKQKAMPNNHKNTPKTTKKQNQLQSIYKRENQQPNLINKVNKKYRTQNNESSPKIYNKTNLNKNFKSEQKKIYTNKGPSVKVKHTPPSLKKNSNGRKVVILKKGKPIKLNKNGGSVKVLNKQNIQFNKNFVNNRYKNGQNNEFVVIENGKEVHSAILFNGNENSKKCNKENEANSTILFKSISFFIPKPKGDVDENIFLRSFITDEYKKEELFGPPNLILDNENDIENDKSDSSLFTFGYNKLID